MYKNRFAYHKRFSVFVYSRVIQYIWNKFPIKNCDSTIENVANIFPFVFTCCWMSIRNRLSIRNVPLYKHAFVILRRDIFVHRFRERHCYYTFTNVTYIWWPLEVVVRFPVGPNANDTFLNWFWVFHQVLRVLGFF